MATQIQAYPVNIKGELTTMPSRGWWLLKWLLAIPHYIILIGLVIAFVVVAFIAFWAILFTGKYPRGLFDFNTGVLRWCWRVGFYSYEALGTDEYPPFTLKSVPDYPADLTIDYPEKLSRGLIFVKTLIMAWPHYIIVSFFTSGGALGWHADKMNFDGPGLIPILAIIAGFCLLFAGRYPKDIFKLVVGFNRWVYRVAAYASLMTDKYPPFRLWDD